LLVILIPGILWHGSTYVVNLLVGNGAVVLEDVVVRSACGVDELLEGRLDRKDEHLFIYFYFYLKERTYQDLAQLVIGDIGELGAVELGNDELQQQVSHVSDGLIDEFEERTAWPLLRGPMSRKARVLSLSKSLKLGISPIHRAGGQPCLGVDSSFSPASPQTTPPMLSLAHAAVGRGWDTLDDAAEDAGHFRWKIGGA
jgi:hypothetical protein